MTCNITVKKSLFTKKFYLVINNTTEIKIKEYQYYAIKRLIKEETK